MTQKALQLLLALICLVLSLALFGMALYLVVFQIADRAFWPLFSVWLGCMALFTATALQR